MKIYNYDNVNFTSRCPQIRDAQKVCHRIAANFPHFSSTRLVPMSDKFENKYSALYDEFINSNPAAGRFPNVVNDEERKILSVFAAVRRLISEINSCRLDRVAINDDFSKIYSIISQLKFERIGNCAEDAQISELILRLNNKRNVYTGRLNVGDRQVDHSVCFFNKDGSEFSGKVGKNTILIDSWLGEVDFADNMLLKYKSIYKDYLFIPKDGKISFRNVKSLNLSETELETLANDFPELIQ